MKKQLIKVFFDIRFLLILLFCILTSAALSAPESPDSSNKKTQMMFGDTSRRGVPYSKDPHVIFFKGRYLMYYSIPPYSNEAQNPIKGWGIGISFSTNLVHWTSIGTITPSQECDAKGLCAPCARVIDGKVHLFYQTYGNGKKDAICHASSTDGITFDKNPTNPIFHPQSDTWNCGRAIDAELFRFRDTYYLYYATRDTEFKRQLLGVASTPVVEGDSHNFDRDRWTDLSVKEPLLSPELPWEGDCIEGASLIEHNGKLYMFYAGAFNNSPQQIGVAVSQDAITWTRLSEHPFLPNGAPGSWNQSESGHPHIFEAPDGRTYLFYQGNNTRGKDWYLSQREVLWETGSPKLK